MTVAAVAALAVLTGCAGQSASPAASSLPASPAASSSRAPLIADPTVVTIGDSIMKGHGLTGDQAWPALMAAQNDWRLDNLACDGAGFLAVGNNSDCGGTFAALVAHAAALHPRTVIVEGSSNDFGQDDTDLAAETLSQLQQLRTALPHAQIIGLSTVWGDTAVPSQLADVDSQVHAAIAAVGGTYVSIGQPLAGHPEWMQSDDVHPNSEGQFALFAAVQNAFRAAGLKA